MDQTEASLTIEHFVHAKSNEQSFTAAVEKSDLRVKSYVQNGVLITEAPNKTWRRTMHRKSPVSSPLCESALKSLLRKKRMPEK